MTTKKAENAIEELTRGGRILISRLQYLGDVILTLPLVEALKERFPNSQIDYLTKRPGAELLAGDPAIAAVHRVPGPGEGVGATLRLVRRLRARRFSLVVDLLSNPRSALLAFSTGAPLRFGGTRRVRRHLYTHTIHVPAEVRSAVEHHLYCLNLLGIAAEQKKPSIFISEEEADKAHSLLERAGSTAGRSKIGIHPGGKWEVKRWPVESFASLAKRIQKQFGAEVFVFRGPGDDGFFTDRLKTLLGGEAVFLPELSVREIAAVMHLLDAGIYNDGGAMHLSIAVGSPTVGIFGSSEPDIWFPYASFGLYRAAFIPVACRPCHCHTCDHLTCLRELTVDAVVQRLIEVLDLSKSSLRAADSQHASNG